MSVVFLAAHTIGPLVLLTGWLGSIRWVVIDARARLRNPHGGRAAVIAAAVAPGIGVLVWLCMRPSETLLERRERRLWTLLLESELRKTARASVAPGLGDAADREHAIDEAVLVQLLPKRELPGFELGGHAAAG